MSLQDFYRRHERSLRQFVKFAIVGGSGVVVNMTVAIILNKLNGGTVNANRVLISVGPLDFSYSNFVWIAGFLVSNLANFQLNRWWTFRSSKHATWRSEFWPFLAVGSVAALAGLLIKTLLTSPWSPLYLPAPFFHEDAGLNSREYWAQLIAIILVMPINFVVNKLWTFRSVRGSRPKAAAEVGS